MSGDATKVKNVFVNTIKDGQSSIVVAREGSINIDQRGDKFLVMGQGRRYDGISAQSDFRVMDFERYGVLVARQSEALVSDLSARSLPTMSLIAKPSRHHNAELLWRISVPLMGLLLMLLAIPLGFVNPRGGRSANLLIALLLFVIYSNMVSVFQASVVQQRLSLAMAWWPLHLAAAILIVVLFSWRLLINNRYHPAAAWGAFKRAYFAKAVA